MESFCITSSRTVLMKKMQLPLGIIYMLYCLIITFINALLIASFIATKQCSINTTNFLITCLSTTYLLTGIILMPIYSYEYIWLDSASCLLQMASAVLTAGLSGINISLTLLIAIDRYIHMDPDFHRNSTILKRCFERQQSMQ